MHARAQFKGCRLRPSSATQLEVDSATPSPALSQLLYSFTSLSPPWNYMILLFIIHLPPEHSAISPSSQSLAPGSVPPVQWALHRQLMSTAETTLEGCREQLGSVL